MGGFVTNNRLPVIVRPMALDDVEQVLRLDRLSFPTPWSARTYHHEIANNDRATMLVVEEPDAEEEPGAGWLERLLGGGREPREPANTAPIVAYAGMWQIAEEAHISTIAVHPDWRGNRIGELLVWTLIWVAIQKDAELVTLEVRVSNEVAINLYRKYGFEVSGRRRGYYRDNNEDAHIMALTPLDAAYRARLARYGRALAEALLVATHGLPSPTTGANRRQ
jgi:ribosomal-protein-alanine N-acetyltransferase